MAAVSADEEDVLAVADSDIWHGVVARVTVGLDVECHWKVCIELCDRQEIGTQAHTQRGHHQLKCIAFQSLTYCVM